MVLAIVRKWTGRYASWTPKRLSCTLILRRTCSWRSHQASRLWKSLYGLSQSPGNWFHTIDPVLISIGFVLLKSDICMYIYDHDGIIIILALYVDDHLVIGGDIQLIEKIKRKLMDQFKMTYMGDVSLVLGMQVTRDRQGKTLTISQENYTKSILERFGMADCKLSSTPGFGPELSTKQPEGTLLNKQR